MAKNYTFSEAVAIIAEGKDLGAITDLGKRYPVLVQKTTVVATKAGEAFVELMSYMPEYLTANKVNTNIKKTITETEADPDNEVEEEDVADVDVVDEAEDTVEATAQWDESMSAKQLWDILGKAGKRKIAKSTKKADLIEACKQAFRGAAAEAEVEAEAKDTDDTESKEAGKYDGKSAMELFKECKARKLKAVPKKPAKYYVELLTKADAASEADDDTESDDWDADDAEKKPAPKAPAKANKKAEVADDGDDWDI